MDAKRFSEIKLDLGDRLELAKVSHPESWRDKVSRTLLDLEGRIKALEEKEGSPTRAPTIKAMEEKEGSPNPAPTKQLRKTLSTRISTYTTTGAYGLEGIPTCLFLVRTNRVALLQCIWLSLCILAFTWVGVSQFIRARSNQEAEWKPEKIVQVQDYGSRDASKVYEMPNVYLFFEATSLEEDSNWLNQNILMTVLGNMLMSQTFFQGSVGLTYLAPGFNTIQTAATVDEATIFPVNVLSNDTFYGCIQLRLDNPDPKIGSAWFWVNLEADGLTLNNTIHIVGFWLYIARDLSGLSLTNLLYLAGRDAIDKEATVSYNVGYRESIHYSLESPQPTNRFEIDLLWSTDYAERWVGDREGLSITLRGSEIVETWEEYVEFSYIDWIFAMGGMLSLVTFWFFFVAYHIARLLSDDHSLGILPGLSKVFRNLEMLAMMKKELEEREILFLRNTSSEIEEDELSSPKEM